MSEDRRACSIVSIRRYVARRSYAKARASVVLPVPGSPPNTISMRLSHTTGAIAAGMSARNYGARHLRGAPDKNSGGEKEQSLERRSHDFHVVHFHERPVCLCIHILSFREHLLEPPWRHADQQHAGLRPDVLEGMRGSAGYEDNGPGRRAHDAVAEFEVKLPTDDVEELVLGSVDVGGRPALGRNGLAKQAERSSGLLACCQQFGDIRRSALRPREMGCTVG